VPLFLTWLITQPVRGATLRTALSCLLLVSSATHFHLKFTGLTAALIPVGFYWEAFQRRLGISALPSAHRWTF
jgi:hypothetical protein